MSEIEKNILAALAYFDMWDYPLTYDEIYSFLENEYAKTDFDQTINNLINCQLIYHIEKFYCLKNDNNLVVRRETGNRNAVEMIKTAKKVSKLLIHFPYVRGIGISGSLSKNFADEQSDIDLFIITQKNRLWVARTIMHLFKKLTFLVNKQHYFCMNYYVDEQQLEIQEKNIYTAIEVATIIPLLGETAFQDFYKANSWMANLLPNKKYLPSASPSKKHFLKQAIENLLNTNAGDKLDNFFMKITAGRWQKKTLRKKLNLRGTVMGMAASKHCAKPDPINFQDQLVKRYYNKLSVLLNQPDNKIA